MEPEICVNRLTLTSCPVSTIISEEYSIADSVLSCCNYLFQTLNIFDEIVSAYVLGTLVLQFKSFSTQLNRQSTGFVLQLNGKNCAFACDPNVQVECLVSNEDGKF